MREYTTTTVRANDFIGLENVYRNPRSVGAGDVAYVAYLAQMKR